LNLTQLHNLLNWVTTAQNWQRSAQITSVQFS
jgi:hypothetical protein